MTYASLLVAVEEGLASDLRVNLSCDLAAAFGSHLIGVSASAPQPPLVDPLSGGAMLGELFTLYRDMAEGDVRRARDRFLEIANERNLKTEWRGGMGYPGAVTCDTARAADLVIVGSRSDRIPYHAPDPGDVLLGCGRPLLIAPPQPARSPLGWPAVVAWKDTREARRAVSAAVPLLDRATKTLVLALTAGDDRARAEAETADVVAFLERHGVKAEARIEDNHDRDTARRILDVADEAQAGLIVAGGYGHARLSEWALGGVTRSLIAEASLCLLMAH